MHRVLATAVVLTLVTTQSRAQSPRTWHLVEEWRKGGAAEGPYAFDQVLDVKALPNARLAVFDLAALRIHILDSAGTVVKSFGRSGGGPGEFARPPMGMAVAPNGQILVNDLNNGRLEVFSPSGDVVRAVSLLRYGAQDFAMDWDGTFDRTGRLMASVGVRGAPPRPGTARPASSIRDSVLVTERWSADFSHADSAAVCAAPPPKHKNPDQFFEKTERLGTDAGPVRGLTLWNVPFAEQKPYFVRDLDGFEWGPVAMGSGELVRRESGHCERIVSRVTLRGSRARIPDSVFTAVRDGFWVEARDRVAHEYPWFHSLRVDDKNRLWVERRIDDGARFDVFSPAGQPVAEIEIPRRLSLSLPIVVANDHLYGFVKNDDDVPYLIAWRITQ